MTPGGDQRGFTLVEALLALTLLGVALTSILPGFLTYLDSNSLSEERSDAVAAAQHVLEEIRQQDPASLPNTGSTAVQLIQVGTREYEVVATYCSDTALCAANRRHVEIEVSFGGTAIYSAATVFGRLR